MKKLIILIPIFLLSATSLIAQTEVMPANGDGTAANPYQIETLGNLFWMANQPARWDKHYIQTANIDAQPTGQWFENQGWPRVGNTTDKFTGSYDGQNYSVSNLSVSVSNLSNQGFFGLVHNAVLKNIRIINITVVGGAKSGGLAGEAVASKIENVYVSGTITSTQYYIGGVIGNLSGGQVQLAESAVTVNGSSSVGGIAGYMSNHAELRHSFSTGSVSGNNSVGGLVGQSYGGWQIISDCYSHVSVTGEKEVGGLVGFLWAGAIYRSFSAGEVTGTSESNIGGLTGAGAGSNVRNSYWDKQTSGQEVSSGGTGLTTTGMKQKISFRNFNFNVLWTIQEGSGYPVFRDLSGYKMPVEITLANLSGSGTEASPYIVTSLDELNAIRQNLTVHYRLGANIDMAHCVLWDMGRGWTPVGTNTTGKRFTGSFDGNGFTLSNLTINRPATNYQGLFGTIENSNMENLEISHMNIQSGANSGGLSGSMVKSYAENINVTGTVMSGGSHVGGLTGTVSGGAIVYSWTDISIEGTSNTGGLSGYLTNHAEVSQCWSLGKVKGTLYVGGLIGQTYGGSQRIADSFSRAFVNGISRVGGLAGFIWAGSVERCYSTGLVTGDEDYIGGLTGQGSNISNSFWDTQTSAQNSGSGGTGKSTAEMKMQNTFADAGWDFSSVWGINAAINDGYPYLREPVAVGAGEDLFATSGISVFPNPFLENFIIDLGKYHTTIVLNISDVSGRTVLLEQYNSVNRIEGTLSGHPPGVYFLDLLSDEGRIVRKLVKN